VRVLSHNYGLISFLLPLLVYAGSLKVNVADTHVLNVLTQYAVWTTGSPSLGAVSHPIIPNWGSFYNVTSFDTIVSNGKFYSVYAPGMSYLSLPFGILGFLLDKGILTTGTLAILADEGFVALCGALSGLVLYKACRLYAGPAASLLASLTLSFGTIVWPFATELFDHDVAMLFSLLGVYCALAFSRMEKAGSRRYLALAAAGASLGIASTVEYLSALLFFPLILFLAFRRKLDLSSGVVLGAVFSLGPILDLFYNLTVTGNLLVFPEDIYGGTAFPSFDLSQLLTVSFYNLLSPYRGLFLFSPVLILGVFGLYKMYQTAKFRGDALLFLSLFLLGLLPYSAWGSWLGGYSFGPRFLVDVIPYLVIPIAFVLSENAESKARRVVFLSLFALSSFIAGSGAFTSSNPPVESSLLQFPPLLQSIPWLLENRLDVWWHHLQPTLAPVAVALCFILIWGVAVSLSSALHVGTTGSSADVNLGVFSHGCASPEADDKPVDDIFFVGQ